MSHFAIPGVTLIGPEDFKGYQIATVAVTETSHLALYRSDHNKVVVMLNERADEEEEQVWDEELEFDLTDFEAIAYAKGIARGLKISDEVSGVPAA